MTAGFTITVYADLDGLSTILKNIENLLEGELSKGSWKINTTVLEPHSDKYQSSDYLIRQFSIEHPTAHHGGRTLHAIHVRTTDTEYVDEFGLRIVESFSPESFVEISNTVLPDTFPWELSSGIDGTEG